MQTAQIKLGGEYAVKNREGRVVAAKVTEIVTTKTLKGTTNVLKAWVDDKRDDNGHPVISTLTPDQLEGPIEAFRELIAKREAEQKAKADAAAALEAKMHKAGKLLAKMIDAQWVPDRYQKGSFRPAYDKDAPAVLVEYGHELKLNEAAFDTVISAFAALFEEQGERK